MRSDQIKFTGNKASIVSITSTKKLLVKKVI